MGVTVGGKRLNKAEFTVSCASPASISIPGHALTLASTPPREKRACAILAAAPDPTCLFRMKDAELASQLIEGAYPDLEQVIPRAYKTRSVMATSAFLKACKQAEIFAREGSHIARINITPGGEEMQPGAVEISGHSEETGFNQTVVDASVEGPALLIAFNVRFLREVLDVVKTPNVALETNAETSPGVIRPVGEDNFLHVIMPMHLGS